MKVLALLLVLLTLALSQENTICQDCEPCDGDYYRDKPTASVGGNSGPCCTSCSTKTCKEAQLDIRCPDPQCTANQRIVRDFYGCCSSCEDLPQEDPCSDAICDELPEGCIKSAIPAGGCCPRCYEFEYKPCANVNCFTTIDSCENGEVIKADPDRGICCDSCPLDSTTTPCDNFHCPEIVECPNGVKPVRYDGTCCETCPDPCATVLCAKPLCNNPIKKEGQCCPVCPCPLDIVCPAIQCTGNSYTPAGACCPVCEESDPCADVECVDDICSIYDRTINYREEDKCCPPRMVIDCFVPECFDSDKNRVDPVRVDGECCPKCPDQNPCRLTLCPAITVCADGTKPVTPPGECCPRCRDNNYCTDRDLSHCEIKEVFCLDGQIEIRDDRCCPRCVRKCDNVRCEISCPEGQIPAPISANDIRPTAECCPPYQCIDDTNKCDEVSCERIKCEEDQRPFFTTDDPCCPVCDVASNTLCEHVRCAEPVCEEGYSLVVPPRECCKTCQKNVRVEYYLPSSSEFDIDEVVRYLIEQFKERGTEITAEDFTVRETENSDGTRGIAVEFNDDSHRDIADRIMTESETYESVTIERFGDEESNISSMSVLAFTLSLMAIFA